MHDHILLHIGPENHVHSEFEKFPQNADCHREAEGDDREENRRQLEAKALVSVEDIDQREADSGSDKAVYGMEHRVPEGEAEVKALHFAEDLRTEYEKQYYRFKGIRKINAEALFDDHRNKEQYQRERAGEHTLPITAEYGKHKRRNDDYPQHDINDKRTFSFC